MIIPFTLLKITQALREIKPGETVEIIGSDPETKRDLSKILRTFSYELVNTHDENTVFRVRLKKESPAA
jgi:TusA-related sulfurtransferase